MLLLGCHNTSFRTVPGRAPVKAFKVTLHGSEAGEIFVSLNSGVRITSLIDMSAFDGLKRDMTSAEARQHFEAPPVQRMHPTMKVLEDVYMTPKAELAFLEAPTSLGSERQVWAYPKNANPTAVILDESLRAQLLGLIPMDRAIRVSILRDVEGQAVTIIMSALKIDALILGARDRE